MNEKIIVNTFANAPVEKVWMCYTNPEHVTGWNFASDDWCCPRAKNDLRVGGMFSSRMEAKDGSMGFNFSGVYTKVVPYQELAYSFGDRSAMVSFEPDGETTRVTVECDPETENPIEMQRGGWQSILNNFKKHVDAE